MGGGLVGGGLGGGDGASSERSARPRSGERSTTLPAAGAAHRRPRVSTGDADGGGAALRTFPRPSDSPASAPGGSDASGAKLDGIWPSSAARHEIHDSLSVFSSHTPQLPAMGTTEGGAGGAARDDAAGGERGGAGARGCATAPLEVGVMEQVAARRELRTAQMVAGAGSAGAAGVVGARAKPAHTPAPGLAGAGGGVAGASVGATALSTLGAAPAYGRAAGDDQHAWGAASQRPQGRAPRRRAR